MARGKAIKVFEVLADGPGAGPAGDGTYVRRFRTRPEAMAFAKSATYYGRPATVMETEAPRHIAERWGMV